MAISRDIIKMEVQELLNSFGGGDGTIYSSEIDLSDHIVDVVTDEILSYTRRTEDNIDSKVGSLIKSTTVTMYKFAQDNKLDSVGVKKITDSSASIEYFDSSSSVGLAGSSTAFDERFYKRLKPYMRNSFHA